MDDVKGASIKQLNVASGINDLKPVFNIRSTDIKEL